jgi:hypothetical protein
MPRLASAASNESEFVANQTFGFIRHKISVGILQEAVAQYSCLGRLIRTHVNIRA